MTQKLEISATQNKNKIKMAANQEKTNISNVMSEVSKIKNKSNNPVEKWQETKRKTSDF